MVSYRRHPFIIFLYRVIGPFRSPMPRRRLQEVRKPSFLFSSACERLWLRYTVYLATPCTFPSSLARGGGPFRFQAGLGSLWKGEGLSQPQHVKYVSIFSRTYLHCMYLLCIHYIHPVARNTVRAASRSMGSIGCRLALGSDGRGRVSPNPRNTV